MKLSRSQIELIGTSQGYSILNALYREDWSTASEVAGFLRIHIATAVKYLSSFHEAGLLERRTRKTKTRDAFEYRLKEPRILIEIDFSEGISTESSAEFYSVLLRQMEEKARKIEGERITTIFLKGGDIDKALFEGILSGNNGSRNSSQGIIDLITEYSIVLARELGNINARSIASFSLKQAAKEARVQNGALEDLIKALPAIFRGDMYE